MFEKYESKNKYEELKAEITVVLMLGLTLFISGILRNILTPRAWLIIQIINSYIGIILIIISIIGYVYIKINLLKHNL